MQYTLSLSLTFPEAATDCVTFSPCHIVIHSSTQRAAAHERIAALTKSAALSVLFLRSLRSQQTETAK